MDFCAEDIFDYQRHNKDSERGKVGKGVVKWKNTTCTTAVCCRKNGNLKW